MWQSSDAHGFFVIPASGVSQPLEPQNTTSNLLESNPSQLFCSNRRGVKQKKQLF